MTVKPFNVEFDGLDQNGNADFRQGLIVVTKKIEGQQKIKIILEGWDDVVWFGRQDGLMGEDGSVRFILECSDIAGKGVAIKHREVGRITGCWDYFYPDYYRESWETLRST